jgi:hypothetical protein
MILLKLILAHLIGDFLLQPKSWIDDKEKNKHSSLYLYAHVALHGLLSFLLLGNFKYWSLVTAIVVGHYAIDLIKLHYQTEKTRIKWFIGDQILHISVIFSCYWLFVRPIINFANLQTNAVWIYITALLVVTNVSGIFIQNLMTNWSKKLGEGKDDSLKNAGKYIGILERLFVFLFVIIGTWEPIGYLLAAKSIFRFGDLRESKDRKLTEYILIGTLLSFGISILVALLVKHLILQLQ